jgi:hypothetical protein
MNRGPHGKAANMNMQRSTAIASCCLLVGLVVFHGRLASGTGDQGSSLFRELTAIGTVGAHAINLDLSMQDARGDGLVPGHEVAITFSSEREAHVTALAVSNNGEVSLLFPNRVHPESGIMPGKRYALVGKGSCAAAFLRKVHGEGSGLILFVGRRPAIPESLEIPAGRGWIRFSGKTGDKIKELTDRIGAVASDEGFNRIVLNVDLKLIDCIADKTDAACARVSGLLPKGAPKSELPVGVSGTQGRTTSAPEDPRGR